MNILVGGIIQESNTFSPARSGLDDFRSYYFRDRQELLEDDGVANELAGFRRAAAESGATLHPLLFAQACSSGPIGRQGLDALKQMLLERIKRWQAGTAGEQGAAGARAAADNADGPDRAEAADAADAAAHLAGDAGLVDGAEAATHLAGDAGSVDGAEAADAASVAVGTSGAGAKAAAGLVGDEGAEAAIGLPVAPGCDGVLFALHGSWVAEDADDADGEIIAAIRSQVGNEVPIVITLDSHANLTARLAANVNAAVGYRTFPHTDYAETGYRAARLLLDHLHGRHGLQLCYEKVPMIVPAEAHATHMEPMRELWAEAAAGEVRGDSLATSLLIVQPWLDVAELGCAVMAVGPDRERARSEAKRLANLLWSKRTAFTIQLWQVKQIVDLLVAGEVAGPAIASDSADSPGAGSPGDSNAVLRQLLAANAQEKLACLLPMVDAAAARAAVEAGAGQHVRLAVGHAASLAYGTPLEIEGKVEFAEAQVTFAFGGGTVSNMEANMGHSAVVRIGGIRLLLMEHPTFTGDPAMYRRVGLEPAKADLVIVKSAAQFRAEYEPLARGGIYILDTPGPSTANLRSLTYVKAPQPLYPFYDEQPGDGR